MNIALCQINTIPGNIRYNVRRVTEELAVIKGLGAQLAVFPELVITGYPPKDLLEYESFIAEAETAISEVRQVCAELQIGALVGNVLRNPFPGKKGLVNAAVFIRPGYDDLVSYKKLLPTYDIFDEDRYFSPAPAELPIPFIEHTDSAGQVLRIGISICEDIWNDCEFWTEERLYPCDPVEQLVASGADIILNVSAAPFVMGRSRLRLDMMRHTARRWGKPVIMVNQVGGCDQVIFDGGSCVALPNGTVPCAAGWLTEQTVIWDTDHREQPDTVTRMIAELDDPTPMITRALKLGVRDYLAKTGFEQALVGNSGGIDSAVVLAIATAALGAEKVISVSMPGPYTSEDTRADSQTLARRLRVRHLEVPIGQPFEAFQALLGHDKLDLSPVLDEPAAIAWENLQARLRGNILMWISNATVSRRTLVLSTGNKSELATGYCTLYGDMVGGLAPISDVPKMMVYEIARCLNEEMGSPIPQTILDREPSAELAPNQKDSDSLPPYPVLDELVRQLVEERRSPDEIIAAKVAPEATVRRVVRMIESAEYKRAQAAPGLKVTSKAFGVGRRMPIARGT